MQVRKRPLPKKHDAGYSLIELMIAVAITGVLATLAIPSWRMLTSRSRQTEAKFALAAMFTAESVFAGEQGSFTCCLYQAGYVPDSASRYYLTGFYNGGTCIWISNFDNNTFCSSGMQPWALGQRNDATFAMSRWANPALTGAGVGGNYQTSSPSTFNAVAFGSVSPESGGMDVWSVDQLKTITNEASGL